MTRDETCGLTVQGQKPKRDRSKLPRWAQQEIDRLERDLKSAYERLAAGPEDSDTFADQHSSVMRPLGKGTSIVFQIGMGRGQRFSARLDGERLFIMGGDGLKVLPRSSNTIEIEISR